VSQTTIRKAVTCSGIGLHSGRKVQLTFRPAPEGSGITFCLVTAGGSRFLTPRPDRVTDTGLATTLGEGDESISTVEHLLAAVRGLGVDNLQIEVHGREVPIMDGSAASFAFLLRSAGIREQGAPRRYLAVKRPALIERDGRRISAEPHHGFRVLYGIDFGHPLIGRQEMEFELAPESFLRRVAKARTFGFLKDVERLQRAGLALGGSLDNAVVLDEYGVVNPEGLRFKDEFVRHKVLDFIGDMAVAPLPLLGSFEVRCAGHAMHNELLRLLTSQPETYLEVVEEALPGLAPEALPEAEGAGFPVPA
jgi:UDP-3-O-[3-hydroxymyristoyl] N-acetylglucosamine deacetylase